MTTRRISFAAFHWLLKTEAAMRVHQRVYPKDGPWRRWIRAQALTLGDTWYPIFWRQAEAILRGERQRFINAEDDDS